MDKFQELPAPPKYFPTVRWYGNRSEETSNGSKFTKNDETGTCYRFIVGFVHLGSLTLAKSQILYSPFTFCGDSPYLLSNGKYKAYSVPRMGELLASFVVKLHCKQSFRQDKMSFQIHYHNYLVFTVNACV